MYIQAAIDTGQTPTSMILSDPSATEWQEIDYKLIKAHYLKIGFMAGSYPVWIDQSPRVMFEAKSFISKSEAAVEQAQSNSSSSNIKGQRWYAIPRVMDGGSMPTMREYLEEQQRKRNDQSTRPAFGNGLGPVLTMED